VRRYTEFRIDASTLKEFPDGSIRVQGRLTHPGVFTYRNPDGSARREYRPAEEVFSARALETFQGSTVTVNHPVTADGQRLVTAQTWKNHAVGHLGEMVREDAGHAVADVYVRDAATVARVKRGELKGLSCGYEVDYDPTPGTTPGGDRYDGVQRNIRGNHVALLPSGTEPRGGDSCSLRLDSAGDELTDETTEVKYPAMTEALQAQISALTGELAKARTDAAEVDGIKKKVAELEAALASANASLEPARLDALVAERAAVVEVAKAAGLDPAGKTTLQVKRLIVAKRTPDLATRVDSLGADTIDTILAVYAAEPHPSLATVLPTPPARTDSNPTPPAVKTVSELHTSFVNAQKDAWKNSGVKVS